MGPQPQSAMTPTNTGQFPEPDQQQQPPAPQQQQPAPQQPAQPNPQQMNVAHDTMMGRAFKVLSGQNTQYSIDPSTGQTVTTKVQNTPGQFFKNIVAAAILGGAAGAEGGAKTEGSGLAAAARGGQAVINQNQQLDQQRLARAQQEYQNQQRAEEMQMKRQEADRQAQAFQTEEQLRKAQIAQANTETLRTNLLTQGADYTQHQDVAEHGRQHFSDYDSAGLQPVVKDVPESEMNDMLKKRPGASAYDWEATGVKTTLDANNKPTYEYTYTAFDPKGQITVSKGTVDQWKKDGLNTYYPDLFSAVKPGRALNAQQYVALKKLDTQLYNENLTRQNNEQKTQADIDKHHEAMAATARDYAEAQKSRTETAAEKLGATQAKQFSSALAELDKAGGDFSKISPSSRLIIGESTTKLLPSLESQLTQQIKEGASQGDIDATMRQMDQLRQLSLGALHPAQTGGTTPNANEPMTATQAIDATASKLSALSPGAAETWLNSTNNKFTPEQTKEIRQKLLDARKSQAAQTRQNIKTGLGALAGNVLNNPTF